jgi:hypothetical protein
MWCGGGQLHKHYQKNQTTRPYRHAAFASWWRARNTVTPNIEVAATPGKRSADESAKNNEEHNGKGILLQLYHARRVLRGGSAKQRRTRAATSFEPGSCGRSSPAAAEKPSVPAPVQQQETGQSVLAAIVNSQLLDNMLRAVIVVQQIMTEFNGAVSEVDKIVAITKIVLNFKRRTFEIVVI